MGTEDPKDGKAATTPAPAAAPAATTPPPAPVSAPTPAAAPAAAPDARAAATGAHAVAEAVKKSADAAANAAAAAAAGQTSGALDVSGSAGGPFTIRGAGFGASGTLTVGGQQIQTTAWGDNRIKGTFPADVKSGTEVIVDSGGKVQKGFFGAPPAK